MSARPSIWLFVAIAAMIAALAYAIGQVSDGAGVPTVILLTLFWTIFAQQRWGKTNG